MKVVLLKSVPNLGKKGDIIEVADGYARNFLIPRGFVIDATSPYSQKLVEALKRQRSREERRLAAKQEIAQRLKGQVFQVEREANSEGSLYAGVSNVELAKLVSKKLSVQIKPNELRLERPLKKVGSYRVIYESSGGAKSEFKVVLKAKT